MAPLVFELTTFCCNFTSRLCSVTVDGTLNMCYGGSGLCRMKMFPLVILAKYHSSTLFQNIPARACDSFSDVTIPARDHIGNGQLTLIRANTRVSFSVY